MYIASVTNGSGSTALLLRESYREEGKVKTRTLANLTHLPEPALEAVRRSLRGETLAAVDDVFQITSSAAHGHVDAVLTAMRRLGVDELLAKRRSRERDCVLAMIAARVLAPASKLATTRWWNTTSLASELGVGDADEDELYAAMDWLVKRQPAIERKLAKRHLKSGGTVLYDMTSTWVEGSRCELAARGYSRDGKPNKLQITFGLMTDEDGRPIASTVYPGNTADPSTVSDQLDQLQDDFGIDHVIFVGDRGMVSQMQIDNFTQRGGVDWITALKSGAIRKLESEGALQLGLFDEVNLFELQSPLYPSERLVACRNPELAARRARKRTELLEATKAELDKVQRMVKRGRLVSAADIGVRAGKVVNKYKVAKHFKLDISDGSFHYRVRRERVAAEAAVDGVYVIRTSLPAERMGADDVVRHYKRLTRIERSFRSMKTVSLEVRPIYHRLEERVRAHIFLCTLAYYVEWHMRQAWAPLLFAEEQDYAASRDPVAKARPSSNARRKASSKKTANGQPVHSFASLLANLAAVVKNQCRRKGAGRREPTFEMRTQPDRLQRRALALLKKL